MNNNLLFKLEKNSSNDIDNRKTVRLDIKNSTLFNNSRNEYNQNWCYFYDVYFKFYSRTFDHSLIEPVKYNLIIDMEHLQNKSKYIEELSNFITNIGFVNERRSTNISSIVELELINVNSFHLGSSRCGQYDEYQLIFSLETFFEKTPFSKIIISYSNDYILMNHLTEKLQEFVTDKFILACNMYMPFENFDTSMEEQ